MLPILTEAEHVARLLSLPRPGEENILAFYEHRLGGISRHARLMLLPLDDHLAHRGDGIFEAIKYVDGRMYGLDTHLARMRNSADGISLTPPCPWERIREIILGVAAAGGAPTGMMRVLLGRGPGGFGIDPAECPEAGLYVVAYRFKPRPDAWYAKGLKGFRTTIPAKQGYLARIKNANYLPNVLMMREARERGADVPFCFDDEGFLAESAIANLCIVDASGVLAVPLFTHSLPGATLRRALELLGDAMPHAMRRIREEDIFVAREVLMFGTGPDCAPVVSYEGRSIGSGNQGPACVLLRALIRRDILEHGVPVPGLIPVS
jgi:branched-chain amino acid aminotransferase